jgi:transcriptional regulator with XRE-family HTH domain
MRKKNPALIKLGEKVRELRKSNGFSQEGFADEVGLDRTYMGGIERGERNIATLNLIRIALALNIEVGELFPPIKTLSIE